MTGATASRFASLALVLATCMATGGAEAAGDVVESRDGRWYGYQTLASDTAAFALMAGGAFLGNRMDSTALGLALGLPGAALYFAGAPLLRLDHGDGAGCDAQPSAEGSLSRRRCSRRWRNRGGCDRAGPLRRLRQPPCMRGLVRG